VRRDLLYVLQHSAVLQVDGDSRRAKCVAAGGVGEGNAGVLIQDIGRFRAFTEVIIA
jgi:hypothetical protein